MNKDQINSLIEKIFTLTKYLIEHPDDDQTIFHLCDTSSKTTAEAIKKFKTLKTMLKRLNGINFEVELNRIFLGN